MIIVTIELTITVTMNDTPNHSTTSPAYITSAFGMTVVVEIELLSGIKLALGIVIVSPTFSFAGPECKSFAFDGMSKVD